MNQQGMILKYLFVACLFDLTTACVPKIIDYGPRQLTVHEGADIDFYCTAEYSYTLCTFVHNDKKCVLEWSEEVGSTTAFDCWDYVGRIRFNGHHNQRKCDITLLNAQLEDAGKWTCNMAYDNYSTGEILEFKGKGVMMMEIIPKVSTTTTTTATTTATATAVTTSLNEFDGVEDYAFNNYDINTDHNDYDLEPSTISETGESINCTSSPRDEHCQCSEIDDNGLSWTGEHGQTVSKRCSEISSILEGTQYWICKSGNFVSENPNRSNCSEKWLPDLIQDVDTKSTTSFDDSEYLGKNLDEAGKTGVTEYAIGQLVGTMNNMLEKRRVEMENEALSLKKQKNFYKSYMKNIDTLLGDQAFKHINSSRGTLLNFGYIKNSIELGQVVTTTETRANNLKFEYNGTLVKSQAIFNLDRDKDIIFTNNKTTITIKKDKLPKIHHANGVIASYKDLTNRYPQSFNGKKLDLWTSMVDYTLFGNSTDPSTELDVEIEFKHEGNCKPPKCVYWDPENQKWRDNGCKVMKTEANVTLCFCKHLTNFGLLFGGTSRDDKYGFDKNMASKVVCGISIALIVGTQLAALCMEKSKHFSKQRKIVEMNRNFCLILALACFVFLSDIPAIRNNPSVCTTITFFNHYLWLATFSWILIEGFLVYKAIIVVFDSGYHRLYPFFIVGYGAPLVIASSTLTIVSVLHRGDETTCNNYSNSEMCHLGEPYIYYALVCPVILVLVVNAYVFIRTAGTTKRTIEKRMKDQRQQMRAWLRSCLTLSVLLSIFWTMNILAGMPFLPDVARNVLQFLAIALHGAVGLFAFLSTIMGNFKTKKAKSLGANATGTSGSRNQPMKDFKEKHANSSAVTQSTSLSVGLTESTTKRRIGASIPILTTEGPTEETQFVENLAETMPTDEFPGLTIDDYENQVSSKTSCQSTGRRLLKQKL